MNLLDQSTAKVLHSLDGTKSTYRRIEWEGLVCRCTTCMHEMKTSGSNHR